VTSSATPATQLLTSVDPPKFDLESYISNYDGTLSMPYYRPDRSNLSPGYTRIDRLQHIGSHSTYLAIDAWRAAIAEAKQGKNVRLYLALAENFALVAPDDPAASIDTAWAEDQTRQVQAEQEKLEHELKSYKNNLIKESIRVRDQTTMETACDVLTPACRWVTRTWGTFTTPAVNGVPRTRPTCACANTAPRTSTSPT